MYPGTYYNTNIIPINIQTILVFVSKKQYLFCIDTLRLRHGFVRSRAEGVHLHMK